MGLTGNFRKFIGFLSLLSAGLAFLFAAGCGSGKDANPPDEGVSLETLVAIAVETQRVEAANSSALAPTVAPGQPMLLMAQTLTPTITPTLAATFTPLPTFPMIATFTPTAPKEPTRQPGDPALQLGEADWTDTFDSPENWALFNGQRSQIEIVDGALRYTMFEAGAGPTWTVSWPELSNFYLEVTARMPASCSGKDRYGLVFRSPDLDQGYRFELACDGTFHAVVFAPDRADEIVIWTAHEAINSGPNQINRLGVWAEGKVLAFYINGVSVTGLTENTFRSGRFGFMISAEETGDFSAVFDNLQFWKFP